MIDELVTNHKINISAGIFIFDSRNEDDLSLSANETHTFVVSGDEEEIQQCIDEIFERFPPSESYGLKKGQYRYRNSDHKLNPVAVKILAKNGVIIHD